MNWRALRRSQMVDYPIDRHLKPAKAELAANAIAGCLKETRAWKSSS